MKDRGTATVAMVGVLLAVTAILLTVVAAGGAVDAHARARGAADVGVLAAAEHARNHRALGKPFAEAACQAAYDIVKRNRADVVSCEVSARGVATLTVRTSDPWRAESHSRAGPTSAR